MKISKLIDKILFYLSVPKCIGCKKRLTANNFALCEECLSEYYNIKNRNCSLCSQHLYRCTCSNKYLDSHYIHKLIKVFRYVHRDQLPSNNLIYSLKRDNRKDVLEFLTNELVDAIKNSVEDTENIIFTNVPRRRENVLKYGADHAALLAKSVAKSFSASYYQPIISKSKREQKHMSGADRVKNARFEMKNRALDLKEKTVIIIDDIVTTGSSMGACAMLLHGLGAKKIIGAVVSIAYKDSYIPFNTDERFIPYKK